MRAIVLWLLLCGVVIGAPNGVLDQPYTFEVQLRDLASGLPSDADSDPTYRVYEGGTYLEITGTLSEADGDNNEGWYVGSFTPTAADFEVGKYYVVRVYATVNGNSDQCAIRFLVDASVASRSALTQQDVANAMCLDSEGVPADGSIQDALIDINALANAANGNAQTASTFASTAATQSTAAATNTATLVSRLTAIRATRLDSLPDEGTVATAEDVANATVGTVPPRDLLPVDFVWELKPSGSGALISTNALYITATDQATVGLRAGINCRISRLLPAGSVLHEVGDPVSSDDTVVSPSKTVGSSCDATMAKMEIDLVANPTPGTYWIDIGITNSAGDGPIPVKVKLIVEAAPE